MQPDADGITVLLQSPRFEVFPAESGMEEVLHHLPPDVKVAITASPKKGLEPTITLAEQVAALGRSVAPHVAARSVRNEAHLAEIVRRLAHAGVTDIFVPAGDNEEPAGPFTSSYHLLTALHDMDHPFEEIGITGYPESHPFLDRATLREALHRKEPLASYAVTQMCFDPAAILAWIRDVREDGVALPVYVGVPGAVDQARLLRIAIKIGIGESLRFLRKTTGILDFVRRLVGARRYEPDAVVEGLAPAACNAGYDVRGVHLYTFNQVAETERWRRRYL